MSTQIDHHYYSFIPFGKIGIGKSSFLNSLINFNQFETSSLAKACTKEISVHQFDINNNTSVLSIDIPGLYDDKGTNEDQKNMKLLANFLRKFEYGLNGIGLVISTSDCRLNSITKKSIKLLNQFIGNDELWSHLCIIVTHCSPYQDDIENLKKSMTFGKDSLKGKIIQLIKGISHIKEDPQIPFFFVDSKHRNDPPSRDTLPQFKDWLFKLSSFKTNNLNEPDVRYQYKKKITKTETSPGNMIPIYTYEPGPIPEYTVYQIPPEFRYIDDPLIGATRLAFRRLNEENKRKAMQSRKMEKVLKGYYQETKVTTKSWMCFWDYELDIINDNNTSFEANHEINFETKTDYFDDKMNPLSSYNNSSKINELKALV